MSQALNVCFLIRQRQLVAVSAISLMLPKAVTGWFAAGTDGQL